jgi:hypothetical protein
VTQALRDARDLLLVANRENPKALGDFGYVVDDSPQAKAKAKPALTQRVFSRSHARRPEGNDRRAALRANSPLSSRTVDLGHRDRVLILADFMASGELASRFARHFC